MSRREDLKRSAGVSKAMKVVDEETRKHVLQKRLASLEADNYQEETFDDEEDDNEGGSDKRKKMKASGTLKSGRSPLRRKLKSLDRILDEERYIKEGIIPYDMIAAAPSKIPSRKFCSVCGYIGQYTCTRCGSRFCSIRCNSNHKETRCLKFSI